MKPTRSFKKYLPIAASSAAVVIWLAGCQTVGNLFSTAQYSESAYQTGKSIKKQSLALIGKARDRAEYRRFAKEDTRLMEQFDSVIASEQQRPKNQPSAEQWKSLKAEMRRFLDLWKTKGRLSPAFVDEQREQVDKHFETLVKTEQEKRHGT